MTFRDLLGKLLKLSDEQLKIPVKVYDALVQEEFDCDLDFDEGGWPFLVFDEEELTEEELQMLEQSKQDIAKGKLIDHQNIKSLNPQA